MRNKMRRILAGLKMFCGIFFGLTGLMAILIGMYYFLIKLVGENYIGVVILVILFFLLALLFGILEYFAPWNSND